MNRFEFERGAHKVFNLDKRVTRGVRFPVRARKPDFHLVPVRFGGCERVVSVADGKQEVGNLAVVFDLYFVRRERVKFFKHGGGIGNAPASDVSAIHIKVCVVQKFQLFAVFVKRLDHRVFPVVDQ